MNVQSRSFVALTLEIFDILVIWHIVATNWVATVPRKMLSKSFLISLNVLIMPVAYLFGAGLDLTNLKAKLQPFRTSHSPTDYICPSVSMRPKFLSYDPIIVYIENFLTDFETEYLKTLAEPLYEDSKVRKGGKKESEDEIGKSPQREQGENNAEDAVQTNPDRRISETAWLPSPNPVVSCVRARAAEFEGYAPNVSLDRLAAVRYPVGGRFNIHYDWDGRRTKQIDRRTSFFATLEADHVVGGATYFPFVSLPAWGNSLKFGSPWCRWIECGHASETEADVDRQGIAVKPIKGNAVFWVNFDEEGGGIHETAHAGEPVLNGTKIGLNIWSMAVIGKAAGGMMDL